MFAYMYNKLIFEMFVGGCEGWSYNLDSGIQQLVLEGRVQLLHRLICPDYHPRLNGVFYVMKKLK